MILDTVSGNGNVILRAEASAENLYQRERAKDRPMDASTRRRELSFSLLRERLGFNGNIRGHVQ